MEKKYSVQSAMERIGCCDQTVIRLLHSGAIKGEKIGGKWSIPESEIDKFMSGRGKTKAYGMHDKYNKAEQLCANCLLATGGCAWSDRFEPVDGWDAEPTKIYIDKKDSIDSFFIRSCPLYKPDEKIHIKHLPDDAFYRLVYAILFDMVREYAHAYKSFVIDHKERGSTYMKMNEIERFADGPVFEEMLGVMKIKTSGPKLLEMIRADPLGVIQRVGRLGDYSKSLLKGEEYDDDYQDN